MEILIVVAILAILVAVVVVSVVGMLGRGSDRGYGLDERSLQTAVSAFYADKHTSSAWYEDGSAAPDFVFPTWNGLSSDLCPGDAVRIGGQNVRRLVKCSDGTTPAGPLDVVEAAIWMGLLVNEPGTGTNPDSKDNSAPLAIEDGQYIQEVPESCSVYNSSKGKGSYTWIVGNYGRVYGVFQDGATWYIGFSGAYP